MRHIDDNAATLPIRHTHAVANTPVQSTRSAATTPLMRTIHTDVTTPNVRPIDASYDASPMQQTDTSADTLSHMRPIDPAVNI